MATRLEHRPRPINTTTVGTTSPWPASLFADTNDGSAVLRTAHGELLAVNPSRWHALPTDEETALLQRAAGPVLDVGCGPGRHVLALIAAGRHALGIDISPAAVAAASRRGAPAIQVSVFGPVPQPGAWGSALLLDGNIGIGGNPQTLLTRLAKLLRADGHLLLEIDPPGQQTRRFQVRVEHAGRHTPWFPWATVAASELPELAGTTGFDVADIWHANQRWFAELVCHHRAASRPVDHPKTVSHHLVRLPG